MILGVTGQIGSGKSTAARTLAGFGGVIVDADVIGRQVIDGNSDLLQRLVTRFGSAIVTPDGRLRRKALARLAFADGDSRAALDRLVHPYLLRELWRQVRAVRRVTPLVIVDAALLPNWGLCEKLDFVLVIHASASTRLRRLVAKGMAETDARARQRAQLSFAAYRACADRIILNNSTAASLAGKLTRFHRELRGEIG